MANRNISKISVGGVSYDVKDKVARDDLNNKSDKPIVFQLTMEASKWDLVNKTYSFEDEYPSDTYNINLSLSGDCTDEQELAFLASRIRGNATDNIAKAKGNVPTIDIPIILEVAKK